ncbi:MAG: hypothetical protein K2F85_06035 [Helicobacter sp.]|nr:hypothetical protein [Helicobacter sp.]
MTESKKLEEIIGIITGAIEKTAKDNEHITPNLNDVYDAFHSLGLRLERTDEHSEIIIKELKNVRANKATLRQACYKLLIFFKRTESK